MCVNDYYQSIIRELMAKHGVEPGDAPYIVSGCNICLRSSTHRPLHRQRT